MKKTKIVCTMGPQEENIELVKQLIEAGMDVARFNFSHGTHEEQLLLDTKGPEIRTGLLKDGQKVELVTGNDIILTCEECVGTAERVSISYKDLYKEVEQGTTILVDDGLMELEVIEVNGLQDQKRRHARREKGMQCSRCEHRSACSHGAGYR